MKLAILLCGILGLAAAYTTQQLQQGKAQSIPKAKGQFDGEGCYDAEYWGCGDHAGSSDIYAELGYCYCDSASYSIGDSCWDIGLNLCYPDGCAALAGGHCGGLLPGGSQATAGCYCDEECFSYYNCCNDIILIDCPVESSLKSMNNLKVDVGMKPAGRRGKDDK